LAESRQMRLAADRALVDADQALVGGEAELGAGVRDVGRRQRGGLAGRLVLGEGGGRASGRVEGESGEGRLS